MTFYYGATELGTGTLNESGVATICTTVLPVGCDTITASYSGDTNYEASDATSIMQKVTQASSTVSDPSSSESESVYGESVTFTVTVTATAARLRAAHGNGEVLRRFNIAGMRAAGWVWGMRRTTTAALGVGTHKITAVYEGDDNFTTGTSDETTQTVDQAATGTVVESSNLAPAYGEAITLTATVTVNSPVRACRPGRSIFTTATP